MGSCPSDTLSNMVYHRGNSLLNALYNIFILSLTQFAQRHGLGCHQYSDDTLFTVVGQLSRLCSINSEQGIASCFWMVKAEPSEIKTTEDGGPVLESRGTGAGGSIFWSSTRRFWWLQWTYGARVWSWIFPFLCRPKSL